MKLTITNIINDFEHQQVLMRTKYCPLIKDTCKIDCYNYYPEQAYIRYKKTAPGNSLTSLKTGSIKKIQDALRSVDIEDIKSYSFITEGCLYFDAFNEWGGVCQVEMM